MIEYPVCKYRDVSERDMDLLFMEAFATDPGFLPIFLSKLGLTEPAAVLQAERSKIDLGLGESDITVIYQYAGGKRALLIEDKIDAIAMPDQHGRYLERGKKGVEAGEYDGFDVFIICPERYRKGNGEAVKYENHVSYEECRDYFSGKEDAINRLRYQQICQAIETSKPEYKVTINEIAVDSFKRYLEYQDTYFPRLESLNQTKKKEINGWWPFFKGANKDIYIIHKANKGYVDLTINGKADQTLELRTIEKWLHENGHREIRLVKTGKSAAFRIETPEISMAVPFRQWNMEDLRRCFEAIQTLHDLAVLFDTVHTALFSNT